MFTTGASFWESLRSFLIVVATAATCLAIFVWTALAVLYFSGSRYQATVLNSPKTNVELCASSFHNSRRSIITRSIIEMGTFTTRIGDLNREYSHFIVGVPTHARPCAFPYKAGTIITIKVAPSIPIAYVETNPVLNLHLPICLSLIGALAFWAVKILGIYT